MSLTISSPVAIATTLRTLKKPDAEFNHMESKLHEYDLRIEDLNYDTIALNEQVEQLRNGEVELRKRDIELERKCRIVTKARPMDLEPAVISLIKWAWNKRSS